MPGLTVAIPTLEREEVLLSTLENIMAQDVAEEIMVLDQTRSHEESTRRLLAHWHEKGLIRWQRLTRPSVVGAMNRALKEAAGDVVLFLDDDIVPGQGLLDAHLRHYNDPGIWAVSGQVLQPGQEPDAGDAAYTTRGIAAYLDFPFNSTRDVLIENGMAGNLSVRRDKALRIGGFDENFIGVAYRFETEFCRRLCRAGGRIRFEPSASIRHLRTEEGGTRFYGNHLVSISPLHGVGDYYFAFRQGLSLQTLIYILRRPLREVSTRFHLRHPWWIPVKLAGEVRAIVLAANLASRGPRYVSSA